MDLDGRRRRRRRRRRLQFIMHSLPSSYLPNQQRWHAKWKLSWNIYTLRKRFCTLGIDLYAQSVLINKISA